AFPCAQFLSYYPTNPNLSCHVEDQKEPLHKLATTGIGAQVIEEEEGLDLITNRDNMVSARSRWITDRDNDEICCAPSMMIIYGLVEIMAVIVVMWFEDFLRFVFFFHFTTATIAS
ncbi:hypothetical protein M8C21_027008, partial [Ambrosia artemisiifolia]